MRYQAGLAFGLSVVCLTGPVALSAVTAPAAFGHRAEPVVASAARADKPSGPSSAVGSRRPGPPALRATPVPPARSAHLLKVSGAPGGQAAERSYWGQVTVNGRLWRKVHFVLSGGSNYM
ncbi:MAG: hypothetical protein K6T30_06380, partial [Alicyclobacillus sp.]|nr:hypothetical protein [Alicyclobacillus sp.]